MVNFDPNQFLQQHYAPTSSPSNVLPGLLLGGGGGAGLGALFASLTGNPLPLAMGLGGLSGGLLGGAVNAGINAKQQDASLQQALAQLTPSQRAAVMQAYGEQMHVPMKESILF